MSKAKITADEIRDIVSSLSRIKLDYLPSYIARDSDGKWHVFNGGQPQYDDSCGEWLLAEDTDNFNYTLVCGVKNNPVCIKIGEE